MAPPSLEVDASTAAPTTVVPTYDAIPYDQEAIHQLLRRAAGSARPNCGGATDEKGQANGPWGKLEVTVTLWRSGRIRAKDVILPEAYRDRPVGECITRSLEGATFPPYDAESDRVIRWKFVIEQPKSLVQEASDAGRADSSLREGVTHR